MKISHTILTSILLFSACTPQSAVPAPQDITAQPSVETPTAVPTVTDTSTWQTYQNEQYGFQFQYPANSFTFDTNDLCNETTPECAITQGTAAIGGQLSITVSKAGVVNGTYHDSYFGDLKNPKIITVNNSTAYQYAVQQSDCHGYVTIIPGQAQTFDVSFNDCYMGGGTPGFPNAQQIDLINQVISTFMFTNATSSPLSLSTITFDGCGKLSTYGSKPWYSSLEQASIHLQSDYWEYEQSSDTRRVTSKNATLKDVSDACYSENGHILVFLMPGGYLQGFTVYRFDTQTHALEKATMLSTTNMEYVGTANEFGKRESSVIHIQARGGDAGAGVDVYFDYDYVQNTLKVTKSYSYSGDAPGLGTWKTY